MCFEIEGLLDEVFLIGVSLADSLSFFFPMAALSVDMLVCTSARCWVNNLSANSELWATASYAFSSAVRR